MLSMELTPVAFCNDTVYVVEHQGEPFSPVKPVVENLGLEWGAQQQKLSKNGLRWGISIIDIPSKSGLQKTLCIPVRKLAGFLATINPSKVRNELRGKIIKYQNECDDALWNYWTKQKRPALPASSLKDTDEFITRYLKIAKAMGYPRSIAAAYAVGAAKEQGLPLPNLPEPEVPEPEPADEKDTINDFLDEWERGETKFPFSLCLIRDLSKAYQQHCLDSGHEPKGVRAASAVIKKRYPHRRWSDFGRVVNPLGKEMHPLPHIIDFYQIVKAGE